MISQPPKSLSLTLFLSFCLIPGFPAAVFGATFTVTNVNDTGDGSLRAAITLANSTANVGDTPDLIDFNIPGGGVHTIAPASSLPIITEPVVIDGYTQGDAEPNTNPVSMGSNAVILLQLDGASAGGNVNGLTITSGSTTVRGLSVTRWANAGIYLLNQTGNLIEGNHIGVDASGQNPGGNFWGMRLETTSRNTIGGLAPGARNVISSSYSQGLDLVYAHENVIQGNFIGTDSQGVLDFGNSSGVATYSFSTNNLIGGAVEGARNLISGNNFAGIIPYKNDTIQGNYIGTDVTGTKAIGNFDGINIDQSGVIGNNLIGGTGPGEGNLISGNLGSGVVLLRSESNNTVQGNLIGTDASGTAPLGNLAYGVRIGGLGGIDNTIGGTEPGAGNIIAYNAGAGVFVDYVNTGNLILSNSIYANGGLGIDLSEGGNQGVTPNDPGDVDTVGGNSLQNYPELTSVTASGGNTTVAGRLNSIPSTLFLLQFFASDYSDPSCYGEGQTLLEPLTGTTEVTTDPAGNVEFSFTFPGNLSDRFISCTATNMTTHETSEFSLNYAPPAVFVNTTSDAAGDDGLTSLREALGCANEHSNDVNPGGQPDFIGFDLSPDDPGHLYYRDDGTPDQVSRANVAPTTATDDSTIADIDPDWPHSWYSIQLTKAFPTITNPVIIDGFSQGQSTAAASDDATTNTNPITLESNAVLRVELDGTNAGFANGVTVNATGTTVRGLIINRFAYNGVFVDTGGTGASVEGHHLGVDASGLVGLGNGTFSGSGVLAGAEGVRVGGFDPGARNVISSNRLQGVDVGAGGHNVLIAGNFIGGNRTGSAALGNLAAGVAVASPGSSGNAIVENTIYGNGALGIDLGSFGPTPNDVGDEDSGANNLQNFPVLDFAGSKANLGSLRGSLSSLPNTQYRIEFFANSECDPAGNGEGQRFLGFEIVTTDNQGFAEFASAPSEPFLPDEFLTATATVQTGSSTYGDTSEFSTCRVVFAVCNPPFPDFANSGRIDAADLLLFYRGFLDADYGFDLTCDALVNGFDLFRFSLEWYDDEFLGGL